MIVSKGVFAGMCGVSASNIANLLKIGKLVSINSKMNTETPQNKSYLELKIQVLEDSKRCTKCGEVKKVAEFHFHQSGKNKVRSICKSCTAINASEAYFKKQNGHKDSEHIRQDSIIRMIKRLDEEYEKADSKRFFSYIEKKYGYKYCKKCKKLQPICCFYVIKTQPPHQCITCFRERKNQDTKKILKTEEGRKKACMRVWFQTKGISSSTVPENIKKIILKRIELNSAIRNTGGI